MDKKKLLSHITVEEFEEILDNYVNKLIVGLGNYSSIINVNPTIPTPPFPRYDTYQPWCGEVKDNIWYDGKNGNL